MSVTSVSPVETTIHTTNSWLKELATELDCDDRLFAYQSLRAVLHALRDHLTLEEVADFGAQLPMLLRGVYFEGWTPNRKPLRERKREDFLAQITANSGEGLVSIYPERSARAVFKVLQKHISAGEIKDITHVLPHEIRSMWALGDDRYGS